MSKLKTHFEAECAVNVYFMFGMIKMFMLLLNQNKIHIQGHNQFAEVYVHVTN